jgi:group I intron endonuclease
MISGIYQIINTVNGKRYVGSSVKVLSRLNGHRKMLVENTHFNRHLQFAWNKYGEEVFNFKVLLYCDKENLLFYEQRAISVNGNGYNLSPTAGNNLGAKYSEESNRKKSKSLKGHPALIGKVAWNRGKSWSEESKRKMSKSSIGQVAWNKGTTGKYSDEHIEKLKVARRKRIIKDETKEKMRKSMLEFYSIKENREKLKSRVPWNKGLKTGPLTEEIKRKMSESRKGGKLSKDHKRKISIAHTGKKLSNKTKEKLRKINLGRKQSQEAIEKKRQSLIEYWKRKRLNEND